MKFYCCVHFILKFDTKWIKCLIKDGGAESELKLYSCFLVIGRQEVL